MIITNEDIIETEKTNIDNSQKIEESSFYYEDDFQFDINQLMTYQLNIGIENYFCNLLKFPLDRIIYASNQYCFRERTRKNGGELNIPFMNYYLTSYEDTDRSWFNHYSNIKYPFRSEECVNLFGSTFRITPVKMIYEATVFFSQHKDTTYAMKELLFESSNETLIEYSLPINEHELKNIGVLNFNLDFNPTYNENDWLEQNKILTIDCSFDIDTFIIKGNTEVPFICNKAILDFITAKNKNQIFDEDKSIHEIIEYFN